VRTLADSQKNVVTLAAIMLVVVLAFLYLGGLLHLYGSAVGVTASGDRLFPAIVMGHLPMAIQVIFLVALVSALFPSADGALTALTSSFCVDILGIRDRRELDERAAVRIRKRVHLSFAALFFVLILGFHALATPSMITVILTLAAYTYGPLLGLFAFAIFTRRRPADRWVPVVAIGALAACYGIDHYQHLVLGDYRIGLELIALNGALTFAGLWLLLFFGRETWGHLLLALGIARQFHLHRLQSAFELFAVMLVAWAIAGVIRTAMRAPGWIALTVGIALGVGALVIGRERADFLAWNSTWGAANLAAFEHQRGALDVLGRSWPGAGGPA